MKKFILLPMLALCALLAGCSTSGYQRAGSTATTLKNSADRLNRGTAQLDATLVALAQLVDNPAPDLKPQFSKFNTAVNNLDSLSRNLGRQSVSIQQQGAAYFQKWDEHLTTIQSASIREASAERKQSVMRQFERVKQNAEEVEAKLVPFVAEMKDIRTALQADLTPAGLNAIRSTSSRLSSKGVAVRESLTNLANEFTQISAALAAATPAPASK
jgi:hypothetical protein